MDKVLLLRRLLRQRSANDTFNHIQTSQRYRSQKRKPIYYLKSQQSSMLRSIVEYQNCIIIY